jgi:hypothetical protein
MDRDRSLTVRIASDSSGQENRHYNVDNVSYLKVIESSITTLGWVLIVGVALVTLALFALADQPAIGVVVAAVLGGGLLWWISEQNGAILGTIAGTKQAIAGDLVQVEETFENRNHELISVSGSESTSLKRYDYRYHFVPDNVVSVQRGSYSVSLRRLVAVAVGLGLVYTVVSGTALQLPDLISYGEFYATTLLSPQNPQNIGRSMVQAVVVVGLATAIKSRTSLPTGRRSGFLTYTLLAVVVFLGYSLAGPWDVLTPGYYDQIFVVLSWVSLILRALITGIVLNAVLTVPPDSLVFHLHGGQRESFATTDADAKEILREFTTRPATSTAEDTSSTAMEANADGRREQASEA